MSKPTTPEKSYVDPFLFEVGFFKDRSERDKLVDGVRKINQRPAPSRKVKR